MEPTVGIELWITMGVLGFFAAIFVAIFSIVFVNERGRGRVENELENHVRRFAELREALNDLVAGMQENHRNTSAAIARLDTKIDRVREELDANIDRAREELDAKLTQLDAKIDRVHRELDAKIDHVREELDAKIDRVHRELSDKMEQNHREVMDSISELKTLMIQILATSRDTEPSLTGDND